MSAGPKTTPIPQDKDSDAALNRKGVMVVCRTLHCRATGVLPWKQFKVENECRWLQERLGKWQDDGTEFCKLVKQLALVTLAECAKKSASIAKEAK